MQATGINGLGDDQEQQQAQVAPREQMSSDDKLKVLAEMVSRFDGAPDISDLYTWKERHGKIFVTSVTGDDIYIFRTIKRNEYKEMAMNGTLDKPFQSQDAIVRKTLLWPKPDVMFMSAGDAGICETLFECVMHCSGFISKQQAISMVDKI